MSSSYQNSLLKKIIDITAAIAFLFTAMAAIYAVMEYRRLNIISTETSLINYDYKLNEYLMKKPYLQSLYAVTPNDVNPKQKAQLLVELCLNDADDKNTKLNWIDVPDLNNKIWEYNGFHNKEKYKLRDFYLYSESILTLIYNAYWAYEYNFIAKDSWESFLGYIDEIGAHPIFLCVFYDECKKGYINKKVAEKIRRTLLGKQENREIISVIYKEMLSPDWYQNLNKRK